MGEYRVRQATAEDFDGLMALYSRYWQTLKDNGEIYDINPETLGDVTTARIKSKLFYVGVAEKDGRLVGFVNCSIISCGREYLYKGLGRVGYINDMYVDADERLSGLATQLLQSAEAWLREQGIQALELEVVRENKGGHKFWQSGGFFERATFYFKEL